MEGHLSIFKGHSQTHTAAAQLLKKQYNHRITNYFVINLTTLEKRKVKTRQISMTVLQQLLFVTLYDI